MKKRIWLAIVRTALRLLLAALRPVSWRAAQAWGVMLGSLVSRIPSRYQGFADKNLRRAYGDSLPPDERRALIRRVYRNFGRAMVEFLKSPALTPARVLTLVRSDVGLGPAEALLARGRGLIVVTAHLGNWELLARRATIEGISLIVVARQGHDAALNRMTDWLRESGGYIVHPRGASPRTLLQQLRRGGAVAILPDQKSDDLFVPFFGHAAGTVAGPAVLALKTGAPILPMFCPIQPDGTYRMEFGPEIDTTATGDTNADTYRIMRDVNRAIEDVVRRYPDQWLWLHDRWRVTPPAEHAEDIPPPGSSAASSRPAGLFSPGKKRVATAEPAAGMGRTVTSSQSWPSPGPEEDGVGTAEDPGKGAGR